MNSLVHGSPAEYHLDALAAEQVLPVQLSDKHNIPGLKHSGNRVTVSIEYRVLFIREPVYTHLVLGAPDRVKGAKFRVLFDRL